MATKEGEKSGGRQKGTPNKITKDLFKKLNDAEFCPATRLICLIDRQEEFIAEYQRSSTNKKRKQQLDKLMMSAESYSIIILRMFDYLYPKRKAVEFKTDVEIPRPIFNINLRNRDEE